MTKHREIMLKSYWIIVDDLDFLSDDWLTPAINVPATFLSMHAVAVATLTEHLLEENYALLVQAGKDRA